jgi:hypothetical protein
MTTVETLMLSVCFGAVMGTFIANGIFIIKNMIDIRKRKKQNKKKEETN